MLLLTQREAALALRLSERTIERMRTGGTGPKFVRLNHSIRYRGTVEQEKGKLGRVVYSSWDRRCGTVGLRPLRRYVINKHERLEIAQVVLKS